MKSIKLTLNYKTGAILEQIVHYVHFEDGKICYTLKKQVNYSVIGEVIKISLDKLTSFDIEETDTQWND